MFQTNLNLFADDYASSFFQMDMDWLKLVELSLSSIIISGPAKSGKRHLAFQVHLIKEAPIFFSNQLCDEQIVHYYDALLAEKRFGIFVLAEEKRVFSADVLSRFGALFPIKIPELSISFFEPFLSFRLKKVGVFLDPVLLKYILVRLPCSYFSVHSFILFLLQQQDISLKSLRVFFNETYL